jgi:hypothetical protein
MATITPSKRQGVKASPHHTLTFGGELSYGGDFTFAVR